MTWSLRPQHHRDQGIQAALSGDGSHLLTRVSYLNVLDPTAEDTSGTTSPAPGFNVATVETDDNNGDGDGSKPVAGWSAWPVDTDRHAAAVERAHPFTSDEIGAQSAWSRRVDAAVHGMDDVDAAGLDGWMQAHATSRVPHLYEARLVAAWETHEDAGRQAADDADGLE